MYDSISVSNPSLQFPVLFIRESQVIFNLIKVVYFVSYDLLQCLQSQVGQFLKLDFCVRSLVMLLLQHMNCFINKATSRVLRR